MRGGPVQKKVFAMFYHMSTATIALNINANEKVDI